MADSIGYLYTIGGYAALFGFGYILWQVSTRKSKKRVGAALINTPKTAKVAPPAEPRKDDKKKKQRIETLVSDGQEPSAKASAKAATQAPNKAPNKAVNKASKPQASKPQAAKVEQKAPEPKPSARDDGDELDNREFARQLAKAQEGHKLNSNGEGSKHREKSVKQSRANKIKAPAEEKARQAVVAEVQSAPSSNGADADDDTSAGNSPETRPFDVSGVSDMLEPAAGGPSILRLTDTSSKKQKKAAKAAAAEPAETKKQRQNRKKAEAAKAVREEVERERKALEEKQRRTARIAEGRAAKDGSELTNGSNGNHSAWTQVGANGGEAERTDESTLYEPLDTTDKAGSGESSGLKASSSWIAALPSEEEQMEMLRDESDEWSTVKAKSKKSKKVASSAEYSGDEGKTAAAGAAKLEAFSKGPSAKGFGAFSALTVKEEFPEDLEEEWEV